MRHVGLASTRPPPPCCPLGSGRLTLSAVAPWLPLSRPNPATPVPAQSDASIGLALMDRFTSAVLDFFQAAINKELQASAGVARVRRMSSAPQPMLSDHVRRPRPSCCGSMGGRRGAGGLLPRKGCLRLGSETRPCALFFDGAFLERARECGLTGCLRGCASV